MNLADQLQSLPRVMIRQKREIAEVFGFETRNKYSIETESGGQLAYAAEQQKGFFGFFFRQALGHWRTYDVHIFGPSRQLEFLAHHPFRFYYQRLEVRKSDGEYLGALERRFEILGKRFDLLDRNGKLLMSVRSPIWRIWTFPFKCDGKEYAVVSKKWSGLLTEVFLDADNFVLTFSRNELSGDERVLLLAAAIFIDLRYFEEKAGRSGSILDWANS